MVKIKHLACSVALLILTVPVGAAQKAGSDWNEFEHVFTGRLDQVVPGPVGQSFPPLYTHTLHLRPCDRRDLLTWTGPRLHC